MSYQQLICRAILGIATLGTSVAADAMSYYKNNGVLKIWGEANNADRTKLKEQLTLDVKIVVLQSPTKGSWALARDLAALIEDASVTTVTQSFCNNLICPALFLAGKERMFSAVMRPEASFISLPISTEYFPEGGEDSERPWSDVTSWWRSHTKLGRSEVWPRHVPLIRPQGTLPAENLVFFHPSAKTSKGSAAECFGQKQQLPFCVPMAENKDALSAGIITTLERYAPDNKADFFNDITPPAPTSFAKISEAPIKIENLNEDCNKYYKEFLTYDSPRAFLVDSEGGCKSAHAQNATPYKTALNNCNSDIAKYKGASCRFYAVDDKVVFIPFSEADPLAAKPSTAKSTSTATLGIKLPANSAEIVFARSSSKEDGPKDIADTFNLQSKIVIFTTFRWTPVDLEAGNQAIEIRWFNGDKLALVSKDTFNFKTTPHWVRFRPNASDIGVGTIRADVYANSVLMGSKTLTITDVVANTPR